MTSQAQCESEFLRPGTLCGWFGQPELGADENINNGVHTEHIKAKYQNCCSLLNFVAFFS